MQLAARLAAILLALTWITPVVQAATVLRDFTPIRGAGHDPAPGSTHIVDAGRITWVGSTTQLRVPAGATVVDLKGKFATPGLLDDHVHVGLVRDVAQRIKFYTHESVEQQLRMYANYGVTGDLPSRMPAEISKAIIDQAHEHKLRALAHISYLDTAKTMVSHGVDGFAHSVRDRPVGTADVSSVFVVGSTVFPQNAGSAAAGAKVFAQCSASHAVGGSAQSNIGPVLNGGVGRGAGTYPGCRYSSAMKRSGLMPARRISRM